MERFKMVQISPDSSRIELLDNGKSVGFFNTPKMANFYIGEVLEREKSVSAPKEVRQPQVFEKVIVKGKRK